MAKVEKGRLDGPWGMRTRTADELREWADKLAAQINDPEIRDDPKWLRRWIDRMRRLADKKEKSLEHKNTQDRRG